VAYPLGSEKAPEERLFSNWKATRAILTFIATTSVGLREEKAERDTEHARRDDK
jgi:hypothetical protein